MVVVVVFELGHLVLRIKQHAKGFLHPVTWLTVLKKLVPRNLSDPAVCVYVCLWCVCLSVCVSVKGIGKDGAPPFRSPHASSGLFIPACRPTG